VQDREYPRAGEILTTIWRRATQAHLLAMNSRSLAPVTKKALDSPSGNDLSIMSASDGLENQIGEAGVKAQAFSKQAGGLVQVGCLPLTMAEDGTTRVLLTRYKALDHSQGLANEGAQAL
jgi:hypothetical protein